MLLVKKFKKYEGLNFMPLNYSGRYSLPRWFSSSKWHISASISQSNALGAVVSEFALLEPHNKCYACASASNAHRLLDFDNHIPES